MTGLMERLAEERAWRRIPRDMLRDRYKGIEFDIRGKSLGGTYKEIQKGRRRHTWRESWMDTPRDT